MNLKKGEKIVSVILILVLSLAAVTFSGCLEEDDETIVVGTSADFPPFEYIDEDTGDIIGFDIDLTKEILEDQGYEVEVKDMDFGTLIPSLEGGEIDVIAAAMTITEEREEKVDFSDPYYEADQSILLREGSDIEVNNIEDLEGYKVGAQTGTTGADVVQEELIDTGLIDEEDFSEYDRYTFAVSDLIDERIDAVVIDRPVGLSFEANRDVEIVYTYETGEEYAFAVQQDNDELREDINQGLGNIRDTDEWDDLVEEYLY
ncbi:MAG: basic amino acid ABC transporter substrate-binding protein [Candidatus Saliniplasma sp.]